MTIQKISYEEFELWNKNPNNIFAGSIEDIYSNVFSNFENNIPELLQANELNSFLILANKNIGYVTPSQRRFAEILNGIGSKCSILIANYLDYMTENVTFENTSNRMSLSRVIKEHLQDFSQLQIGDQCLTERNLKNLKILKKIGSGSFGNVYLAGIKATTLALKMATISKFDLKKPYDPSMNKWHEIHILKNYTNSLIEKGICQNFPYVYDTFICDTCDFERQKDTKTTVKKLPCYIIATELASGDLTNWHVGRNKKDLFNALFQSMAGIHALQKYFQIKNNDIKAPNILYKEVPEGGCWEYVIRGRHYYIPNNGYICFINDFGVSSCYDPTLEICGKHDRKLNLNYRPFLIIDNTFSVLDYVKTRNANPLRIMKDKKHYIGLPIELGKKINTEINFTQEQLDVLKYQDPNDPLFYSDYELIPFFDSYVDVQDLLLTFIGGKRVSQPGDHPGIGKEITPELQKYVFPENINFMIRNMDKYKVIPAMFLAGFFIEDFFGKSKMFDRPSGQILQKFVI